MIFFVIESQGRIHRHYLSWSHYKSPMFTPLQFSLLAQSRLSQTNKVLELLVSVNGPESQVGMRLSCWTGGGGGETEWQQVLSWLGTD